MLDFLGTELLFLSIFFGTTFIGVSLFDRWAKRQERLGRTEMPK